MKPDHGPATATIDAVQLRPPGDIAGASLMGGSNYPEKRIPVAQWRLACASVV
jgi:hypothetical protein